MISKKDVKRVAQLARLKLTAKEEVKFQKNLSVVLDYFDVLKKAPVGKAEPTVRVLASENVTREDAVSRERPETVRAMMRLLPAVKEGFLKVKAVFSGQ